MEQQTQHVETPASPDSVSDSTSFARCRSRKRSGGRCRLRVQDPATGLCFRHVALARKTPAAPDDCTDLYDEIFAAGRPVLGTVEDINSLLSNVVTLVARGRSLHGEPPSSPTPSASFFAASSSWTPETPTRRPKSSLAPRPPPTMIRPIPHPHTQTPHPPRTPTPKPPTMPWKITLA